MPLTAPLAIEEYHALVEAGEAGRVELLEGVLVAKMSQGDRHRIATQEGAAAVAAAVPAGWSMQSQAPVTFGDSEPEPDIAVIRGRHRDYRRRHAGPGEVGLIIEVADPSLAQDRTEKARIYARAGVPHYWIANLVDNVVEVRSSPADERYSVARTWRTGDRIPLVLDGAEAARIPADALLAL